MGITERKQRQKEEVRSSILKAAWQLVEKEGWQALSIRKIADAIEYSVPVIYDHFANKEAILLEFTRRGFDLLDNELAKAKDQHQEPEKQLEALAFAYWEFAFRNNEYYQLMYGLGMPTCETVREIRELERFTQIILDPIGKMIAAGSQPQTDPMIKLHTFWSMLHGLISINMINKEGRCDDRNRNVLKDFIGSMIISIKG
jgi:AcrR family transcriptional regulator